MADKDMMYPGMDESEEDDSKEMPSKHEEDHQTALLPLKFFESKEPQPGDKCEVEIVRCYENECEVRYVPHKEKGKSEAEPSEADDALEGMATERESGRV